MRTFLLIIGAFFMITLAGFTQPGVDPVKEAGCNADFSAVVDPDNPMRVIFTDLSSGAVSNWHWSFGDGTTSVLRNPVHTYAHGGTYFVCLTVSGTDTTGFLCNDVLCVAITIHEPGKCIADYSYKTDTADHFTLRFSDLSSGNIDSWHWDFGDGTVSGDRNPVHRYNNNGDYRVCLVAYKSDSASACSDVKCDSVRIHPSVPCHASFTASFDTLNQNPNTWIFTNTSTGDYNRILWTIDEVSHYYTGVVKHQFTTPGIHRVCLTVTEESQGLSLCSDSLCMQVVAVRYVQLGGHLFAGEYPINNPLPTGDTGIAYLYRNSGAQVLAYDTIVFTHLGYYAFPQILKGQYLIRTVLTETSEHYHEFLPTYFSGSLTWHTLQPLVVSDSGQFRADVKMVLAPISNSGNGIIRGNVTRFVRSPVSSFVPGATVLLYDSEMNPVQFRTTKNTGDFEFRDLAFGAYNLYVDYPGLYSRYTPVWLDEIKPVADDMELLLFDHDVTGIDDPGNASITVGLPHPNPARNIMTLPVITRYPEILIYRLYNVTGTVVKEGEMSCNAGKNDLAIEVGDLTPGLYMISMISSQGTLSTKVKFLKF